MRRKSLSVIAVLVIFLLGISVVAGCSSKAVSTTEEEKPIVAVSIVPQQTFVEAVGGDLVEVIVMIPPGSSPANYEPTPQEMEQFSKSKLYFAIGVPTEEENIIPKASETNTMEIVRLQEDVSEVYPDRELASGRRDPHIWLSPRRVMVMIRAITREISRIDPDNSHLYEENAQNYIAELEQIDKQIQTILDHVENRKFIVFHPAFGYLADDYGLKMYALEKDGKEATAQRLKEMIDLAKEEDIKIIFFQSEISSRQAQSFAEEIGGETIQLAPLAPNYIDNLRNMAELMAEVMQ